VVIGNAITRGNPEVEEVLNRRLYYLALPVVLKQFSRVAAKIWASLGRTEKNADAILRRLVPLLRKNDIVVVFSDGGFDWDSREAARTARSIGVQ
jgi:hypothetical protein